MSTTRITLPNELMLGSVRELLSEGQEVIIMTKGLSMLPFIEGKRDSVLLKKLESVVPGDIVLAELSAGHFVLHRVRTVEGESLTLQGDGNLSGQEHCRLADVAGTVLAIQREGRADVDPHSPRQLRRWRRWTAFPYQVRRYYLALYRRIKHITI